MLIARSGRRRGPKAADVWRSRAVDAYAKGSALNDAMRLAEAPGALIAADAAARWADIQRRADDLGQALYAMREAAPDEDKRMRAADVLAALQAVRSVMAAERGSDVSAVPPPEQVRSRLVAFGAALQELRASRTTPALLKAPAALSASSSTMYTTLGALRAPWAARTGAPSRAPSP